MAEKSGLGFIFWFIISALTIISLLITIRNGLGVDDVITGGAAVLSTGKAGLSFLKGPAKQPTVIYKQWGRANVSYGSWWK